MFSVKVYSIDTDFALLETLIRGITADGLVWGESGIDHLAFDIKILKIAAVIEDDKVCLLVRNL